MAEHTFRPPWYHMNIMSEFMGLIYGVYDAKPEGFVPGGMSLHNCMLPHGPDKQAYDHATKVELKPVKLDGHHGLHVRDALSPAPDQVRRRARDAAGRLCGLLDAAARRPSPEPSEVRGALTRVRALPDDEAVEGVLGDLPPGQLLLAEGVAWSRTPA